MDRITVKSATMASAASRQDKLSSELYRFADEIGNIQRSLSFNVKSRAKISSQLLTLEKVCENNAVKVKRLSSTLNDAIALYASIENKISQNPTGATPVGKKGAGAVSEKTNDNSKTDGKISFKDIWDFIEGWKYVGEAGIIGSLIATIGKAITGGTPLIKTLMQGGKDISKLIGNIAGAVPKSGASFDWKNLVGIAANEKGPISVWESLKDQFGKYSFKNASTVSDKIKVASKWAGSILTVGLTAYDNFTDTTENNSTGRKIAETIGESTVKVLGGIAIGALAGTIGAPAVVTGAITVGVTWGINKAFEAVTGKGAAEWFSDAVLDNAPKVYNNIKKGIGDAVNSAGKTISGWWKKAFG